MISVIENQWYEGLLVALDSETGKRLPGALVGNKSDREEARQVSSAEGRIYADSLGWPFFEGSAKTGENVQDVFTRIAKELYSRHPPR
jgi:GTPase SAR1 family protein